MNNHSHNTKLNSLAIKIIILFLIVIIPVYGLGLQLYVNGRSKINNQIISSSKSQVNLYANTLVNELNSIQKIQFESINDQDTLYLANAYEILDNFERSQYTLRAQNRLVVLSESSKCIDSVTLHIVPISKTISPTRIDPINPNWKNDYLASYHDERRVVVENGRLCLYINYPIVSKEDKDPILVMKIVISNESIEDILRGFDGSDGNILYLTNSDMTYLVSNETNIYDYAKFIESVDFSDQDSIESVYGKESVRLTKTTLEDYDLSLVLISPVSQLSIPSREFKMIFLVFTMISLLLIVVFAVSIHRIVHKPFKTLVDAFGELEKGNFDITINNSSKDEFQYLYDNFNQTVNKLKISVDQAYKLKIETQRSQLKQLQSQINPHFLYNSFFNIRQMAQSKDCESIAEFTEYLGNYYQYITRNNSDEVTLDKEIEHARTYLNIQSIRFGNKIHIIFDDYPHEFAKFTVPRLIIQPIIENAFEHGLKTVKNPTITVSFETNERYIRIKIKDNGKGIDESKLAILRQQLNDSSSQIETTGLINTHRRLKMYFGNNSGLELHREEDGFSTTLTIEKRTSNV